MTTSFTTNLRLSKPDFRSPGWADAVNNNMDALDAAIRNVLMNTVPWANLLSVGIGQVIVDTITTPSTFWIVNFTHVIAATPLTFAQERAANPTWYSAFSFGLRARGAWANGTQYLVNDISYDSVRGITGIAKAAHTSIAVGSILDDAANWDFIVNLPTVFTAIATSYNNATSHLTSTNVQAAVDEIQALVAGAYISSNIAYDHSASGMAATNVKTALDELKAVTVASQASIAANTTAITTGLISSGFVHWQPTAEVLVGWVVLNGLTLGSAGSGATGRANADAAAAYAWHWNNFPNTQCPVATGRGANAAADFSANKAITMLDMKGIAPIGMDTMGGAVSTKLTGVPVTSGNATTAGSVLGENMRTMTAGELVAHLHAVFLNLIDPGHLHSSFGNTNNLSAQGPYVNVGASNNQCNALNTGSSVTGITGTVRDTSGGGGTANQTANTGSTTAHNNVPLSMTGTWYVKL